MGHAARDVTDGYETAELREYVVADRARVLERLAVAEVANATKRRAGLRSA